MPHARTIVAENVEVSWLGAGSASVANSYDFAGARITLERTNPRTWRRLQPTSRFQPFALLLISGSAALQQFGNEIRLHKNSSVFLDASQPFRFDVIAQSRLLYLSFPTSAFVPGDFARAAARVVGTSERERKIFADLLRNLWQTLPDLRPSQHGAALSAALSTASLATDFFSDQGLDGSDNRVERCKDYIEQNIGSERLTAQLVADCHGLSRRRLDALFRQTAGISVDRWIWERRLSRAKEQLSIPNFRRQSLLQVALELGFKSPSHFSRSFSKRFGTPPREYWQGKCQELNRGMN